MDSETDELIVGATVNVTDSEGNIVGTKITSDKGQVDYIIECNTTLYLTGSMDEYESGTASVEETSEEEVSVEILLDPIDEIILANKIIPITSFLSLINFSI